MLVKLEYIYEKVVEMFIKMVENPLTIFNTLCTTHYLEFKTIPPSEYEKILRQHNIFINNMFSDIKLKTFKDDYYKNFCPNIILEESKTQDYMKSYLKVKNLS